ncbi:hypothetical protein KCP75_05760 [Salmonella enterica subsp. enterica]|nr:hypothetical protein KCP75_05760 [Salmonella enterica subsp. enterica]
MAFLNLNLVSGIFPPIRCYSSTIASRKCQIVQTSSPRYRVSFTFPRSMTPDTSNMPRGHLLPILPHSHGR